MMFSHSPDNRNSQSRDASFHSVDSMRFDGEHGSYDEEQIYEDETDFDSLYGADAFLGDQYPVTKTGKLAESLPPAVLQPSSGLPLLDVPNIEARQEQVQTVENLQSESIEGAEAEAANAGRSLPSD